MEITKNMGEELVEFIDDVVLLCESVLPVLTEDLPKQVKRRAVDEFYPDAVRLASDVLGQATTLLMGLGVARDLVQENLDREQAETSPASFQR